ncbi:replication endonuclease [Sulfurospirillum halorespirans]|uniref:Putative phage replication protein n=1 Tax=Sulfurospirillum halorespirans DSM 13726 TaxID=1193502 RepID=A0A1D7THT3_9BACT|nr:replication endonuclease [Sulfurospirillum halorespirans]AOO64559.1 putative phage replication protein [Sulfurospirillum halorespirans DSM 13726]
MYGLDQHKRKVAKDKIRNVKFFLDNNFIKFGDTEVPYSNFFKNAFINPNRYIAEIQNRVWSIFNYATARNLVNVFCTITCPPDFHRLKKLNGGNIVRNRKYNPENTPKVASKFLSKMLAKILKDNFYSSIPREDRCYFRVTEPHHDGTPHLHISFFIPEDKVEKFVKLFTRHFPEPLGKIETKVDNPVSYLMKYVLKTLDDLRYGEDNISDLTLWYVYHGICRIYTSRTLISLDVYRVLGGRYSLNELTVMYKEKRLSVYVHPETNKVLQVFDEFGRIWVKKMPVIDFAMSKVQKPCIKQHKKPIKIEIFSKNGVLLNPIQKPIAHRKNYDLMQYYHSLNPDLSNFQHFVLVQNECIKRGLIQGDILPVNILGTDINPYLNQFAKFKDYLNANPKKVDDHFTALIALSEEKRIADNKNRRLPKHVDLLPDLETVIEHDRQSTIYDFGA